MNVTFLIGNGFDVHLGLKSKFADFYDEYIKLNSNYNHPIIEKFCCYLKADKAAHGCYENWSDFETAFPKYVNNSEEVIVILNDFSQKFFSYLSKIDYKNDRVSRIIVDEFKEFLFEGYRNAIIPQDINNIDHFFASGENFNFNFVNFNYTHLLNSLILSFNNYLRENKVNELSVQLSEFHIHGSLDESIIIGIDNIGQLPLKCRSESDIEQYCVKKSTNNLIGNGIEEKFENIINESQLVIAYGMSFGDSDLSRWTVLRKWLLADKNNSIIVYMYKPKFPINHRAYFPIFLKEFNDLKSDFLINKLHMPINVIDAQLLNRVMLVDSDTVLNFDLIKENNVVSPINVAEEDEPHLVYPLS